MDLIVVAATSILLVPVAALTSGPPRIVLGLAFVLFFPGYSLMAALFPRKSDLSGVERLALSFGLSIAVVPLIGLALNYTPWGIRFAPILVSLTCFILAMAAVGTFRRYRMPAESRFDPRWRPRFRTLSLGWGRQGRWDRALTVALVLAVIGAAGTLAYAIATPKVGERFTEFYVLGPGGKAEGYPREIAAGQEGHVILGVINDEHMPMIYHIAVTVGGTRVKDIGPISLDHAQRWEQPVTFCATQPGAKQQVEFLLYKGQASELYRSLHLWVDVTRAP